MLRLLARLFVIPWALSLMAYKLTYKDHSYGRNRLEYMNPWLKGMIDARRRSGYPAHHMR